MVESTKANSRRGKRAVLFVLLALVISIAVVLVLALDEPAPPEVYFELALGTTRERVDEILSIEGFYVNTAKEFTGRQKDQTVADECGTLRWSDSEKWHKRFTSATYRTRDWAVQLDFDQDGTLAGKSLIQVDHYDQSFLRNPRLWIRRFFGRNQVIS